MSDEEVISRMREEIEDVFDIGEDETAFVDFTEHKDIEWNEDVAMVRKVILEGSVRTSDKVLKFEIEDRS